MQSEKEKGKKMNKRIATFCQTEQAILSIGEQEKFFRFLRSPFIKGSRNSTAYTDSYDWCTLSVWAQPAIPLHKNPPKSN